MNNSDSTDNPSENRSPTLKKWAALSEHQAKAVDAYEKVICATEAPRPPRYNIQIKGQQFNLSKGECLKLYRTLLEALSHETETEIDTIKLAVSRALRIPIRHLASPTRYEYIVEARHGAMWLARRLGITLTEIAEAFSKHHATVMHSVKSFERRMATHRKLKERFEQLESEIKELLDK